MNVLSLYRLHERTIQSDKEAKSAELTEFTYEVRNRFYTPFRGFSKINMPSLEQKLLEESQFLEAFLSVMKKAAKDSLYDGIYFSRNSDEVCRDGIIQKYDKRLSRFRSTNQFPKLVCDGVSLAETRMRPLIEDYRWNNKVFFDNNRSMSMALINLNDQRVVGYVTFVVNKDYLLEKYFRSSLVSKFGDPDMSGIIVWLVDWTKGKVLISNDLTKPFDRSHVFQSLKFPNLFDSWGLYMAYTENATLSASQSSLIRNLIILGIVVFLLLGTLIFNFTTAQREQELSHRQASFLANVTHELKTPISVMQAAGENLSDGRVTDPKRLKQYGNHIYEESVRLKNMINKLLDVAKADADQLMVNAAPCEPTTLVSEIVSSKRDYVENLGFTFRLHTENIDRLIMIDREHFYTMFVNLLDNAIKYSHTDKHITVSVEDRAKEVAISISDRGVGIKPKDQKQIFTKFFRAEDALTAKTKGHGLGLSIVRNLVELNGGSISVASEPGLGTTFTLIFPYLLEQNRTQIDESAPNTRAYAEEQFG